MNEENSCLVSAYLWPSMMLLNPFEFSIFVNDFIKTSIPLWHGDITAETVPSWFLLNLKVVQLTRNRVYMKQVKHSGTKQ